ncbi:hypothetical protein G3M48_006121 [Beauveria asiatica]|uniref:Uncharacterized protein n=1 Tax=Beauveria asiatica TaxID=1069075 RepID=A0AAW0RQJ6_9HYPO
MINDDLEIVHVKNLAEGAKLDVALCVVAEGRWSTGGDYSDSSQNGADTILGALSLAISAWRESACAATFDTITARAARRDVALQNSRCTGTPALRGGPGAGHEKQHGRVRQDADLDEATKDAITQAEMLRQRAERMADWEGHVVSGIVIHNEAMPTPFVLVPFLKDPSVCCEMIQSRKSWRKLGRGTQQRYLATPSVLLPTSIDYVSGGHSPIAHYIKASKPYSFRATLAIGKTGPTLCGELQAILFLSSLAYQHHHARGPRLPHGECSVKTRRHPVWSDHVKDANTQSSSAERATDMTGLVHTRRG